MAVNKTKFVILIILCILVGFPLFQVSCLFINMARFPDYLCPLPNGYQLVRLSSSNVEIGSIFGKRQEIKPLINEIDLLEKKQEVKPLIYEIDLLPNVVVGKRGRVRSNFQLDSKVYFFCLDTKQDSYVEFETKDDLLSFINQNYSINDVNFVQPRDLYKKYRKNHRAGRKNRLIHSYMLVYYYYGNCYLRGTLTYELKINPVKINEINGCVVGYSANNHDLFRGDDITEGYFILLPEDGNAGSIEDGTFIGLPRENYDVMLKNFGIEKVELQSIDKFIKTYKEDSRAGRVH